MRLVAVPEVMPQPLPMGDHSQTPQPAKHCVGLHRLLLTDWKASVTYSGLSDSLVKSA